MKHRLRQKKVVLAVGYHDVYPDILGFVECGQIRLFPVLFAMVTKIEPCLGYCGKFQSGT